jgi:hypothetical protein
VERGFVIVPSTVKTSTAAYEWVMFDKQTNEKAVLQVKSGTAWIDVSDLAKIPCSVFVVAADGAIGGDIPGNVLPILRDELLNFALRRRDLMPERIRRYLEWANL